MNYLKKAILWVSSIDPERADLSILVLSLLASLVFLSFKLGLLALLLVILITVGVSLVSIGVFFFFFWVWHHLVTWAKK